jgi:23S rRNA (cytosine1962-C5)-methyltransferase
VIVPDPTLVMEQCRRRWDPDAPAATRRLFHGRGRCFPGFEHLTIDRYGSIVLIACFGRATDTAEAVAGLLAESLPTLGGVCIQHRQGPRTRSEVVAGEVPEEVVVVEDGLRYAVAPLKNQNVGLFLDMAPTRAWVRRHAAGARVLNLFAFTCAFSVAAIAGGAVDVLNNDMSRQALDWGRRNHALNGHDPRRVGMLAQNVFKSFTRLARLGPFDLIIMDPPTSQRGSFNAERQYGLLFRRIGDLAAPGADVIAALNSPFLGESFLPEQAARSAPGLQLIGRLPASPDFPDRHPDRGLKIMHFRCP